jgi:hypothetical protein
MREWSASTALHGAARVALSGLARNPVDDSLATAVETYADVAERYPWTLGASEAEDTVRALLTDALVRLRKQAVEDPQRAEAFLLRLGRIRMPGDTREFWRRSRDQFLETFDIAAAREAAVAATAAAEE